MSPSHNSSFPDDRPHRGREKASQTTKGDLIKDPIRCPLCSTRLMCPRKMDPDDYVDRVLTSCLKGPNPTCMKQAANPKNAPYIAALQIRVSNATEKPRSTS